MKSLICIMLLIFVIGMASSVEQLSRPADKVIILGSITAKNITNLTNIINLTNVTNQMQMNITNQKQMNITNQKQMNISGLQKSFFQPDVNESMMEAPSQADFQPALSRYLWSSLGK
jgi:hypothetical protein